MVNELNIGDLRLIKRKYKHIYAKIVMVLLVVIILCGCFTKHESLNFGTTFTDLDSEFRFLSAERYSSKTRDNGGSLYYQDVIIVYMEWTCTGNSDCIVGGADFSLTTSNPSGYYPNTPDIIIYYPNRIPIPEGIYSCCGKILGGEKATVYLAWNENGCSSYDQYWVKYQRFLGGEGPVYYVDLPESVKCNH